MPRTQQNREFRLESPLGDDVLLFQRMTFQERLGGLYELDLVALSENHAIDLDNILGQTVTVTMEIGDDSPRYFHGVVTTFAQDGMIGELSRYRAMVRPWIWLLTRSADCRIFQNKTVPEIVTEVLREKGYTDIRQSLNGKYIAREYCVQYRESDFDFISRLLEEEGIYYFFEHQQTKHTMVLADGRTSHKTISGYEKIPYFPASGNVRRERDHIDDWSISREVQAGSYTLSDFDFECPKADLNAKSTVKRNHAQAANEIFDYPGGYLKAPQGQDLTLARIDELQSQHERIVGHGNARGIMSGALFTLDRFPRRDQNREHLVVSVRHDLDSDSYQSGGSGASTYSCSFTAISSQQTYRPPRTTHRPTVQGPQTAIVVGKEGEDIWTDKYGRVKVQFHWDRKGKADENSSCWVRVAQMWAGKKWGGQFIPRTGQEVVVEFLEGNPDKPIITGSVYNGDHLPPFALPENMTQSGIRSRTTKDGNDKTSNEFRFEDKKDKEQIYLHAERDFDRVVENSETARIGFDKHDPGDQKIEVYNDCTLSVEKGNHKIEIKEKDALLTVAKGNQSIEVSKGNQTIEITAGDHVLNVGAGTSTITAAKCIELKVGGSSLKIEPAKITIKSAEIAIEASAKVEMKGGIIQEEASGMMVLKGGVVKIN